MLDETIRRKFRCASMAAAAGKPYRLPSDNPYSRLPKLAGIADKHSYFVALRHRMIDNQAACLKRSPKY